MALKLLLVTLAALATLAIVAWLKLRGPDIPYAELEARYAGQGSAFVELPGGLHLHYQAAGHPERPVVVLIHGYGDAFTAWEGWTPRLAADYRVLSIDLPGHGLTSAPPGYRLSADGLVRVVDDFASALALPRFAIVGNSMGGGVAWQYALRHPERLSALVLVDAAGWPMPPPKDLPLAFRILRYRAGRWLLARIDNRPLIEEGLRKDVVDPSKITPAFVDRWAELQRAPGHRAILMSPDLGSFASASESTLGTIRVPTLVLHGEADPLIPLESGRRFAAAIPGARLISYPQVGHLPQVEIPAQSAGDVAAFLGGLAP
jgi:pimeloyl-ACP methyl ester carboxylesterase